MSLNIYSPKDVSVLIGGVFPLSGYLDGTFLELTKEAQPYSSRNTPDGTTHRVHIKNSNYLIKFSLAQTSDSNNKLGRLHYVDEVTQKGDFPILIKDTLGTSLLFSPKAWIEGVPDQTFSTSVEGRVWTIKATSCVSIIGGNSGDTSDLDNVLDSVLSVATTYVNVMGG